MALDLTGTWKFIRSILHDVNGNELIDPVNAAQGLIIYTQTHMAVQLYLPKEQNVNSSVEMLADHFAYYGTYHFDANTSTVTHNIIGASIREMINRSVKRKVKSISHDTISLLTIEPERYGVTTPAFRELFWQKTED